LWPDDLTQLPGHILRAFATHGNPPGPSAE
jgi:hypothetical protein